ncbi:hypothetical protein CPC735_033990 [Coccidioides posadasii C735 delta SOWgp]|uniref:Uncharacterized protein n=2 Tax=Coccidioides posadasii TaxID=199306 RepID=A0A0J6FFJ4_COCPO|nr:hypothetical protein CPC735_033990 [Coccidioides posadasii C735 delta SOWgp]EER28063.1 hypothetical protein CPC735_033990 [Coccidioides posadasii C735 delta SOWgp]KMM68090.1 hypothetical protein CPAG_04422 [Coccidioides posadasii RMSCC 3488]|eukprot:XP_003070208.1 hypothetical protein CPC735_033990 [Coccidioides posadasii C735 delta SOWgp]
MVSTHDQTIPAVPYILQLPKELLLEIFDWLVDVNPPCHERGRTWNGTFWAVALACRRFYATATPYLYRSMQFGGAKIEHGFYPIGDPVICLFNTLKSRPDLRRHCRHLILHHMPLLKTRMAGEIFTLLTNVRTLELGGDTFSRLWPHLIFHISSIPLQSLKLSQPQISGELALLVRRFPPALTSLTLSGYWRTQADLFLKYAEKRCDTVTSLKLLNSELFHCGVFEALVMMFPKLEHFTLEMAAQFPPCRHLEPPALTRVLRKCRDSLKSLTLRPLDFPRGAWNMATFNFPNLETLQIPGHMLTGGCGDFRDTADMIVCPKLRRLVLEYFYGDTFANTSADLGKPDVQWLYEFAEHSYMQRPALQEIKVQFDNKIYMCPGDRYYLYPWVMLNNLQREISRFGIKLTYDEPENPWDGFRFPYHARAEMWPCPLHPYSFRRLSQERAPPDDVPKSTFATEISWTT